MNYTADRTALKPFSLKEGKLGIKMYCTIILGPILSAKKTITANC